MYRCFGEVMADVLVSDPGQLLEPLERAHEQLADEIIETLEVIEEGKEKGIDCGELHRCLV